MTAAMRPGTWGDRLTVTSSACRSGAPTNDSERGMEMSGGASLNPVGGWTLLSVRAHREIEQYLKTSGPRWASPQPTGYMRAGRA